MENPKPAPKPVKPVGAPAEQKIPDHRKHIQQSTTVTDGEDG